MSPDVDLFYKKESVFDYNITRNLNTMADHAGIYKYLWRPDELGITKAKQLIEPLSIGLHVLEINQEYFKSFNPENGWGDYGGLVRFVKEYLAACKEYPKATIEISR